MKSKQDVKKIVNEIWLAYNEMNDERFCHYMVERFGVEQYLQREN